jgi:16S rRNA (cytidine1402-2'-O)-methyltransferase
MFLGYPPEKEGHRQKLFQSLKAVSSLIPVTYIMYCAPHKFTVMIDEMKTELGDIEITVSRELTKLHEEVWRGSISQSLVHFAPMKGELVILFRI